jgi:MFS superfamily sulfate permease-like transporter
LAGAVQLVAGFLKFGQWFRAISPAVIYGMLAGIGILIFGAQFHVMVDDEPKANGVLNLISIPEAVYKGIFPVDGSTHHMAAFIGLLTILVLLAWNQFAPQKVKLVPGALVAVVVGTAAAGLWKLPIRYVQVPDNLFAAIQWIQPASFVQVLQPELIFSALTLAFVASAETLLSATAVDQMHDGPRANYDRELSSQGVGNILSGLLGGLPMTGVIVRSSTNVAAGAQTRLSTILHGIWLLALVAALPFVLRLVPTACLAAILVYTGYKLVNPANIRRLLRYGGLPVAIYAATVVFIVATDLLTGIIVGLVLSLAKLIYAFSHLGIRVEKDLGLSRADLHLDGAATFIRLPKLADTLESVPADVREVHIHCQNLAYIDHACLDVLMNWEKQRSGRGSTVVMEWTELMEMYRKRHSFRQPAPVETSRMSAS